ncbi:MAG: EAL domain-containing protein [Hahellaceae bacterium]|nr:EAL domain-containing protein [Hahellaceae bacterium]
MKSNLHVRLALCVMPLIAALLLLQVILFGTLSWGAALFFVLATAVVGLVVMNVAYKLVIRPVQELQKIARRIGDGDLDYLTEKDSSFVDTGCRMDEIGELARTLNEMSAGMQKSNMRLKIIAYHDNLTGLYNRHMFYKHLKKALAVPLPAQESLVVLFVDMDGFKEVNDTLGHEIGDNVLKTIARRAHEVSLSSHLKDLLGNRHLELAVNLYRTGGDEFALILEGQRALEAGLLCAGEIVSIMQRPFEVGEHSYHLGSSVGIAVYPDDASDASTLLKRADLAMFNAKQQGGNVALRYLPDMEFAAIETHKMENDLRKALDENQFELYYQPQFSIDSGELVGCEALMRWTHPERGAVSPAYFIPYAEQNGLIVSMGEWALREACRQNKAWQDAGLKKIRVAVNFSTEQFNRMSDIVGMVRDTLSSTGMDPQCLDIEITESGIMQSGDVAIETLNAIKALGVHLSMDDFGTGYSSLASLRDLPIDKLKIDRSFVNGIHHGERGQTLIQAIIALSNRLGVKVVAEGVEDQDQLDFLGKENCEFVQGYLTGRPLSVADMETLLRSQSDIQANNDSQANAEAGADNRSNAANR